MPDLADRLEDLAGAPPSLRLDDVRARVAQRRRRRRLARVAAPALAIGLLGGVVAAAVGVGGAEDDPQVDLIGRPSTSTSTSAPTTTAPPVSVGTGPGEVLDLGDGWHRYPAWPLDAEAGLNGIGREGVTTVWTGSELVAWGGDVDGDPGPYADGAALDPTTATWRVLSPAPLRARSDHVAVWTGEEVVIWGGRDRPELDGREAFADGAAYDPEADSWRAVSPAPLTGGRGYRGTWTGSEVVIVGGHGEADLADGQQPRERFNEAAAYDPATDTWRVLPDLPVDLSFVDAIQWTGTEVLVTGGQSFTSSQFRNLRGEVLAASLDLATGRWRVLPPSGISAQAATAAWTGAELLVTTYQPVVDGAVAWVPAADRWEERPALPTGGCEGHPTLVRAGDQVYGDLCGAFARYDPATRSWVALPLPGQGAVGLYPGALWTGSELLALSGLGTVVGYAP